MATPKDPDRMGRWMVLVALPAFLALLLLLAWPVGAASQDGDDAAPAVRENRVSFLEAFKDGDLTLAFRYRFEVVDQDRFSQRAEASTLRTTLSFRTLDWRGWSLLVEAEDVTAVFDDDGYANAGAGDRNNGVTGVPVVADPDLTEINQSFVAWRNERLHLVAGRQEINLGDQRFVGAVGWRQNHQSFDALRLRVQPHERVAVDYTFAAAANRIFGDHVSMASHFLEVPVKVGEAGRLRIQGFVLDYDDAPFQALSTATYGLAWKGERPIGERFTVRYHAEAAQQDDAGDNPFAVDTDYLRLALGADLGRVAVDVGFEVLGDAGGGGRAFQTPLATLHKWNGWADLFLQTPIDGLEDLSLRASGTAGEHLRWSLVWHDFRSARGSIDYGTEIDGEVVFTAPWKQVIALKMALYDADAFGSDTDKVMLWSSFTF